MDKSKIVIWVLIAVPVLMILFLLALVNVLLMLVGVIVVLAILLVLRNRKPEWFSFSQKQEEVPLQPSTHDSFNPEDEKKRVYMVLAGHGDFGARRIMINKTSYYIGRSDDNDFSIDGSKISRHHLEIRYDEKEQVCYAVDNQSRNGTYLNSVRMEPFRSYRLVQGDHIMIDGRDFTVEYARFFS